LKRSAVPREYFTGGKIRTKPWAEGSRQRSPRKLYRLLDEAAAHQPVSITRPRSNAVLVAEEDWNSAPIDECAREPGW